MARFAIGDIHGCLNTFQSLVEDEIKLQKEDILYLLGDLVNKGPNSKGVIDYIFKLKRNNFQVFCIRGNHDQMLLDAYYGRFANYWFNEHAEPKTLKSFGVDKVDDIPVKYFDFIKELPFFVELDNFFLVHAGFNFSGISPFNDFKAMLHLRQMEIKPEQINFKTLVHGHVPTSKEKIISSLKKERNYEINIDSGCVYYLDSVLGFLTAINLDTLELIFKENVDKPYNIDFKK